MAVAFDAQSSGTSTNFTTTVSHTVGGGSNTILIVFVSDLAGGLSSVTYNSVGMTQIGTSIGSTTAWYMLAPTSGTHDIVALYDTPATNCVGGMSFTGVLQTGSAINANATQSGTGAGANTKTITTTVANCMLVENMESRAGAANSTAGSSQTTTYNATSGSVNNIGGGYKLVTSATGYSESWTPGNSTANELFLVALAPIPPTYSPDLFPIILM